MSQIDDRVELAVERVITFTKGHKEVDLLVGGIQVQIPVSEITFLSLPVTLGDPNRILVPRWIVLERGLEHALRW